MGLPLYQAPVESDIQSKCATGKSLAEARSSIRRHRLVRAFDARDRVRERHRRTIAEAVSLDQARRRSPTIEAPSRRSVWENHTPAALDDDEALERDRRVLQDVASRIGSLDDRVFAVFGGSQPRSDTQETVRSLQRQLQNLESRSRARISNGTSAMRSDAPTSGADSSQEAFPESFYPETEDGPPVVAAVRLPSFMEGFGGSRTDNAPPRPRLSGPFEQYTLSEMRSTQDPNHPSRSSTTSPATTAPPAPLAPLAPVPPSAHPNSTNSLRRHIWDGLMNWHTVPSTRQTDEQDPTTSTSRLDGLGDRNRSLSPEGDNAWETLLTTLTPDPQPPSVGSSFASASASAAATQSTVAASSATSLANLDTHADDQSGVEPPCESGYDNDNSDMEEDEEDELPFILPSLRYRRADGVVTDAALDLMGGSEVIQHLVRSLARREDIPDEWWAQVGLSRTLSREATAD